MRATEPVTLLVHVLTVLCPQASQSTVHAHTTSLCRLLSEKGRATEEGGPEGPLVARKRREEKRWEDRRGERKEKEYSAQQWTFSYNLTTAFYR